MAGKRRPGQPTRYRKNYCQLLIEHMSQGLSFDTFGGVVDVARDTIYEWVKVHPEFSDAKKLGTSKRNLLVERAYVQSTLNPTKHKFNTPQMIYWTKNTLGWSDNVKVESEVTQTQRLVIEAPSE